MRNDTLDRLLGTTARYLGLADPTARPARAALFRHCMQGTGTVRIWRDEHAVQDGVLSPQIFSDLTVAPARAASS